MKRTIATLVRVGCDSTYVTRSFERMDDKAIAAIRGCIEEDCEETFTKEEIEAYYAKDLSSLKDDYDWLGEPEYDFDGNGECIWEYNDEVEVISYILHVSIIESR